MGEGSSKNFVMDSISIRLGASTWVLDTNGIQHIIMRGFRVGVEYKWNSTHLGVHHL